MDNSLFVISQLMVNIFNDILKIEETAIRESTFCDISIKEIHTIEAIGLHNRQTMGEIAKKLGITDGTLSVAVNNMVKKGYVRRYKSDDDRRVVLIGLSKKGRVLYRMHARFHEQAAKESINVLTDLEVRALTSALSKVHVFLESKYIKRNGAENENRSY